MSQPESMRELVQVLREAATVETVFGDPVETQEKTVVPVAKVAFGFGGGYGAGPGAGVASEPESEEAEGGRGEAAEDGEFEGGRGEGGGFGGGLTAKPVGVLEVTQTETRFVHFAERRKLVGAALVGVLVGLLLGRRRES